MRLLAIFILFSSVNAAFADEGPLDDLGCHENEAQTNYHCHAGPLAGARYRDRAAAEAALSARGPASTSDEDDAADQAPGEVLDLIGWTFGGASPDAERLASVVGRADLVVLRGLGAGTEAFANKLGNSIDARLQKKICRGYRAGEVYLWRDQSLAFARKDGTLADACGARAHEVGPGAVVFQMRRGKRLFTLGTNALGWPSLVLEETFAAAAKAKYQLSHKHVPESLWTRDVFVVDARTINLRQAFGDLKPREIEKRFGRATPIESHLSFTEPTREVIQFVKKDPRTKSVPSPAPGPADPAFEAYPAPVDTKELSKIEEDLDGEERAARVAPQPSARKRRKGK